MLIWSTLRSITISEQIPSDKETIWQSTEGYWPDPYTNPLYDVIGAPVLGNAQLTIVPSQELVDAYDMLATGKPVLGFIETL
ncbi:hypothetical protein NXW75_21820 [Bacteroides xylanisolvens]|nr:hypothetical protein [Bacteroides xylanisolvens]